MAQRLLMRRVLGVRMAAVSQSVKRLEQGTFHNRSLVIPNWFDNDRYRPRQPAEREAARAAFGIDPGATVISTVANCSTIKNHAAVLRAMASVSAAVNIIYLHAGDEKEDPSERALAARLGIADRVKFLGAVEDVRAVLDASDLFVMPSLKEGCSIATIEAMGVGVPVALSDVEGLRDFRETCSSIYWIEPTARGVGDAILHFHAAGAVERNEVGEELSAAAHRNFGISTGAAQYAALYRGEKL